MKTTLPSLFTAIALAGLVAAGCGDDDPAAQPDAPPQVDAAPDAPPTATVYKQIEQLARPGINEALILSEGFLAGYNATAPTFAGVDPATLNMVVAEAKTVLKAIYLGVCLVNGAAGLTPQTGLAPAGMQCAEVGPDIFEANGTVKAAVMTAAMAYADQVFGQFIPDVMRIDTSVDSAYLTLCDTATSAPLLCGGRKLNEDVIDITYNYLLAGAAITPASPAQFQALVSDGVHFSSNNAENASNLTLPDPNNPNQFHPNVSATFPYSAPPI